MNLLSKIASLAMRLPLVGRFVALIWLSRESSYLRKQGWFLSAETGSPIDGDNNPIPWYTYSSIFFFDKQLKDRSDLVVFEYGCGNSTLWWAQRAAQVISCENDKNWIRNIEKNMPANVSIKHFELGDEYVDAIRREDQRFDIVVIDGRLRNRCAMEASKKLSEQGVIIFDNSDRDKYAESLEYLQANGFRRIDFNGLGSIVNYRTETAVLYRDGNCLGI